MQSKQAAPRGGSGQKVPILPGISILNVLSRLNYKSWYAIAEFVDNSIQSFLDNKEKIRKTDGKKSILKVVISYDSRDGGTLRIKDNAGGIAERQFPRAFRPAQVPADTSGLHEYGMGMKSAACWFSPNWVVRTSEIGSPFIKAVNFDIKKIVKDDLKELDVHPEKASADLHFTEIVLRDLHRPLQGRTIAKIKSHLASIYRHYLNDGILEIEFDGKLIFENVKILKAPHFKDPKGSPKTWKKDLNFGLGKGRTISGFAAIRETASTTEAGFALFRKNRLIQGSLDDTWRPEQLFGSPNKFRYQRIFGELHLSGFEVSHTKDGFVWDESEELLIDRLKSELGKNSLDILGQADGYRARVSSEDIEAPVNRALQKLGPGFSKDLEKVLESSAKKMGALQGKAVPKSLKSSPKKASKKIYKVIEFKYRDSAWQIEVIFDRIPSAEDLIEISDSKSAGAHVRKLAARVNTDHPFYQNFVGTDSRAIEVITRFAVALTIAETLARDGGVAKAGIVRNLLNEVLRKALGK